MMSLLPYDDRDGWIWFDGSFVPWRSATVHVLTHGLHYASSVFEGERMYDGRIFALEEHTKRLIHSASLLDFDIPFSEAEISEACNAVCAKNGLTDAYVRPIAWRGSEQLGISSSLSKVHLAVAAWQTGNAFSLEEAPAGIRLCWAKYRRPSPETAPSGGKAGGLYMICMVSKQAAERSGYDDALMLDWRGHIAEATGSNIFFIRDQTLHTPTTEGILNGITRQTVIRMARNQGFEVQEREIDPEEVRTFSECFVTGTLAEVMPVREIDGHLFDDGPHARSIREAYSALVRKGVHA